MTRAEELKEIMIAVINGDYSLEEGFRRELYLEKQLVDRKEKNMKQIFITTERERNIARFCEQKDCNQKDAVATTEEDFRSKLKEKKWLDFQIEEFIDGLKKNPFNNWVQYD